MKIQRILLAVTTFMLLTINPVWADHGREKGGLLDEHKHDLEKPTERGHGGVKAPEIDAASGTSAIALLTGVLLLAGERSRSRRS